MSDAPRSHSVSGLVVRIMARSMAVLLILILLAFMMPEEGGSFLAQWHPSGLSPWTYVFPLGFLFSLFLVLWKDLLGGILSIACILATYVRFALDGEWLGGVMAFGVLPGVLSIIAWSLTRRHMAAFPGDQRCV